MEEKPEFEKVFRVVGIWAIVFVVSFYLGKWGCTGKPAAPQRRKVQQQMMHDTDGNAWAVPYETNY